MPPSHPQFVHLHVHSEFSLLDGVARIKPLVQQTAAQRMPALALTDQNNMFALIRFYRAAMNAGVKPICGVDLYLRDEENSNKPFRLILLVQNDQGYRHLTELVSHSYQEGQHLGRPMVDRAWLTPENCTGLLALSGARDGDIGRALLASNAELAEQRLRYWLDLFGDRFYIQLVRTGREHEETCLHASVALAIKCQVPVVATNAVCFLSPEDFSAHEVRVCIYDGRTLDDPRRPRLYSDQQYLRSPEEMLELFSDIPEAIANTVEIAKRCNLSLSLGKSYLPDFPIPAGTTIDEFLRDEAHKGLDIRLAQIFDKDAEDFTQKRKSYDERLQLELDVIITMGFPGYFLIVADFIRWAKANQVPVGPGRGSGAGSLVAYALLITDLDPIDLDLLFERFLNPERVSMPDFDIDFCMDKRDQVIDYVASTYGRDAVSQIITFGSMAAKAVVRDVGRVLGHPYGFTDRVAKMIPLDLGMTLDKALEESEDLAKAYTDDEEVTQLIDMAKQLEGLARNAGKHAGGVVIAPGKLTDFAPLYCEADGTNLVTQYDKDDVELAGLVKFDFLGLRTLTIIDWALATVNRQRQQQGGAPINIESIPLDDPAAFALLKTAEATALFQLESPGMRQLISKLQPDSFDDITALVALFRPGPLQSGMVDNFINRKHGREPIAYPDPHYQHESLKPILESTYGIILYQEQVMQIAQVMAGYTLGEADLLRRAMGKKKPEEMAQQRQVFQQGAAANGIDAKLAIKIFDLVEKFAGYGFNKSHSAAYALVSYQTLWLKTHYPAAFMAAVLSADMDNTDKVVTLIEACRSMQLTVEAPDINRSVYPFTIDGDATVIYGLGAIKGVGEGAIEGIVQVREQGGAFSDLFELCRRIDLKKANRRVLESLIRAGALDALGANRATLMMQLPFALKFAEKQAQDRSAGILDMFDLTPDMAPVNHDVVPADIEEWDDAVRLQGEKETLGLFLTGHPMDAYAMQLSGLIATRIANLNLDEGTGKHQRSGKKVRIAGLVVAINRRNTQRGPMASVLLDDKTARIEVTLFSEAYERYRDIVASDAILVAEGSLVHDDYRGGLAIRADHVQTLQAYQAASTTGMHLTLREAWLHSQGLSCVDVVRQLQDLLQPYRGGVCKISLRYQRPNAEALLRFGTGWTVGINDELLKKITQWLGEDAIKLHFTVPAMDV